MIRWIGAILFLPLVLFAQSKSYPYRAQTISEEVPVYRDADFDSPVIATLPEGKTFEVSHRKFNEAFFRLRVKPGVLGYVSDADVKTFFASGEKKAGKVRKKSQKPDEPQDKKAQRPFQFTQYGGFQYAMIQYQEDTMGDRRKEDLGFFGAKISGPNLIIEGEIPTEMNFLFHYGAPSYYEKLTGKPADGWILLMDFLFQNYYPQSKNTMAFFGFGPVLKYSKFNATLTDPTTGKASDYNLEDFSFGAVFNAGAAVRFRQMALRAEAQYYWEKMSYLGLSLSLQFAF
jgi:hypothetical protein